MEYGNAAAIASSMHLSRLLKSKHCGHWLQSVWRQLPSQPCFLERIVLQRSSNCLLFYLLVYALLMNCQHPRNLFTITVTKYESREKEV